MKLTTIFDTDNKLKELKTLEDSMAQSDFWNDQESANKTITKIKFIRAQTEEWVSLKVKIFEISKLIEMSHEENDTSLQDELSNEIDSLIKNYESLELKSLLSDKIDINNCYLYIHPGAGGTESCDWASMLMRMYLRWAEEHKYDMSIIDLQDGDEAGIDRVTLYIKGPYAYGYLKGESGVHRLVRISPFDANKRRHTSFASVYAYPEIDDSISIDIKESDIRIDTYRSSGKGGQHVNTTDSAVRITHIPTGIVVTCQNERSQHKNKAVAMKMLRSKLYQFELGKKEKEIQEQENQKKEIAWGSQIRSYVFHPYNLIKDHRTGIETGNTGKVMDGNIDMFIDAYLKQSIANSSKSKSPK